MLLAALTALALISGCGDHSGASRPMTGPAHSSSSASSVSPAAVVSPSPPLTAARPTGALRNPPEVVSRNGFLNTRIVVERKRVELAGKKLWALTYNGRYMPPTLRIKPGDRVKLAMVNKIDQMTNLHVHGLHVSPSGHSDNIFLMIEPGETYHYSYQFPRNLAAGTYWYHPHPHTLSAPQTAGGMSGIIIVDGLKRYLPKSLRNITERVVALKDFQRVGDQIKTADLSIGAPTTRVVNGQLNPAIHIRPGETQLWRIANIGANIFYKVVLPGHRFRVIARDGNPVTKTYSVDTIIIPAAARYDVLVEGGPPGTTELKTLPYNTGPAGNQFPEATLATLVSRGEARTPVKPPAAFAPARDLAKAKLAARRTITYTENAAGTEYYINGKQFDPNRIDFTGQLNTVQEWTVQNNSDEVHSFHVHTNDFQLMSTNGKPQTFYGYQDTVDVPARGNIVVRTAFENYTGKTVLHCHILNHEDKGMMSVLELVDGPPGNGTGTGTGNGTGTGTGTGTGRDPAAPGVKKD
ncbi:multicopper oxidase family protein [Streptomyces sp. NBC_00872]|uniref:multicopper oxidase family protein n=1 Tax=Streptomyces sp. NBC_00872 TaxID=2903686 RepID=UPI00386AF6C2|nr:multicopper oxidase family protein [Streptomyces sp. NBC_00872]